MRFGEVNLRTHNTHNHCVTLMENNCWGPVLIRVSPYIISHRTTSWAYRTTTCTQHPQQLRDTNGTQLSGPRVNKGFPYIKYHTEPLREHTEPLRTHNTHNHCVTLMENICQGTQNHFVGIQNHYVHTTATTTVQHYWKTTVGAPC